MIKEFSTTFVTISFEVKRCRDNTIHLHKFNKIKFSTETLKHISITTLRLTWGEKMLHKYV